jgi:hypothetical protein
MSIRERLAKITPGRTSDFGAQPSKLQQRVMDRTHEAIDKSKSAKRKSIRQKKKQAKDSGTVYRHNPPAVAACRNTRSGGRSFGREELLASMRGLDPTSSAYIMLQEAQDRSSYPAAFAGICMKAIDLHIQHKWCRTKSGNNTKPVDAGKDVVRSMCRLALFELDDPKCVKCKGTMVGRNGGPCRRCRGLNGAMRISDKDRAIALNVGYHAYRKTYAKRYAEVMNMIRAIGSSAIRHMRDNLYGKESSQQEQNSDE